MARPKISEMASRPFYVFHGNCSTCRSMVVLRENGNFFIIFEIDIPSFTHLIVIFVIRDFNLTNCSFINIADNKVTNIFRVNFQVPINWRGSSCCYPGYKTHSSQNKREIGAQVTLLHDIS